MGRDFAMRMLSLRRTHEQQDARTFGVEFCEETSLVGFKYLLEHYGPNLRRFIWALIVLALVVATFYQVGLQIQTYYQNPITVRIDKTFHERLRFPVVVICNTMQYRVSEVRPHKRMHRALNEIYSDSSLRLAAIDKHERTLKSQNDTDRYLNTIAMQKEDMIVSCKWKGKECNADDFERVNTDQGVCYAFNDVGALARSDNMAVNGRRIPRTVSRPGADNGLQLVLNAETYEQTVGPHSTLGIILSLVPQRSHDRETTVSLQQQINALIGVSTNIAVKHEVLEFVTNCGTAPLDYLYRDGYTRKDCILDRKIGKIMTDCGCRYLIADYQEKTERRDQVEVVPPCNFYQYFNCALPILENDNVLRSKDDCPSECHVDTFRATVSQARTAWDRVQKDVKDKQHKAEVEAKLLIANEIIKRHVPDYDVQTADMLYRIGNRTEDLLKFRNSVNSLTCLMPKPFVSQPPDLRSKFEHIKHYIKQTFAPAMRQTYNKVGGVMLEFDKSFKGVFSQYLDRSAVVSADVEYIEQLGLNASEFTLHDRKVYMTLLENWIDTLEELKKETEKFEDEEHHAIFTIDDETILSDSQMAFHNEAMDALTHLGFRRHGCLHKEVSTLKLGNRTATATLVEAATCMMQHFASESMKTAFARDLHRLFQAEDLHISSDAVTQTKYCDRIVCWLAKNDTHCSLTETEYSVLADEVYLNMTIALDACRSAEDRALERFSEFANIYTGEALHKYEGLKSSAENLTDHLKFVEETFNYDLWQLDSTIRQITSDITSYMNDEKKTFRDLANRTIQIYYPWIQQGGANWSVAKHTLEKLDAAYEVMLDNIRLFHLIVYNDTTRLKVGPERNKLHGGTLADSGNEEHVLQVVFDHMLWQTDTARNVKTIEECVERLHNETRQKISEMDAHVEHFVASIDFLHTESLEYLKILHINQNFFKENYMSVNIFFEELSTQFIIQESSYTFFTLVADIGGTSGLFMGFCIVSLFELIDITLRKFYKGSRSAVKNVKRRTSVLPTTSQPPPRQKFSLNTISEETSPGGFRNGSSPPNGEIRISLE